MTGADLIAEARTLIGTSFGHMGRTEHSLDCAGLILLPAWRCQLTTFAPKNYSPGGGNDQVLECLESECIEVEEEMRPGEIGRAHV